MNFLLGITLLPLICLGISIIIGVVILVTLRRGTQTISQYAEKTSEGSGTTSSANTRWARADLKGEPQEVIEVSAFTTCPACGAKNPDGNSVCQYCGEKL